jgi:hypothetical protein
VVAVSSSQLDSVFRSLPVNLITEHQVTKISVAFVGLGALFAALAILLGKAWRPLP